MSRKVVSVMIVNRMKFIVLDWLLVFLMEGSFFYIVLTSSCSQQLVKLMKDFNVGTMVRFQCYLAFSRENACLNLTVTNMSEITDSGCQSIIYCKRR